MADGWALLRVDDGPPGDWTQDGISLVVDGLVLVNLFSLHSGLQCHQSRPRKGLFVTLYSFLLAVHSCRLSIYVLTFDLDVEPWKEALPLNLAFDASHRYPADFFARHV